MDTEKHSAKAPSSHRSYAAFPTPLLDPPEMSIGRHGREHLRYRRLGARPLATTPRSRPCSTDS
jgi:hypothetical protein